MKNSRIFMSLLVVLSLIGFPFSAFALLDFGGWVRNTPSLGGMMNSRALPVMPPVGVSSFIYPPCINGVQEVDMQSPPTGPQAPFIMLQFMGAYTFSHGPARSPGQAIIGKYMPGMVCMAIYVTWVYCGFSLCPVIFPLPFFFAPLILWNGSSQI